MNLLMTVYVEVRVGQSRTTNSIMLLVFLVSKTYANVRLIYYYNTLHTTKKSSPPDFHRFRG